MLKRAVLAAIFAACLLSPAQAGKHHHHVPWCGLYMMRVEGKTDPRLARAREWAREGVDAGGPGIGVIVVWLHHVGKIVGRNAIGQWIVNSGNDGNRVRTRPRDLSRVIAFRRL